ncbi:hypothetical protein KDL29_10315 [bacterium]|nr:hypothetical protein [bacterium]
MDTYRANLLSGSRKGCYLWQLLETYTLLVNHCRNGMTGTVEEYQDFVCIRSDIETTIHDPKLVERSEYVDFKETVDRLDVEFREATLELENDGSENNCWWYSRLPKLGDKEFANSVKEIHGIEIQEL